MTTTATQQADLDPSGDPTYKLYMLGSGRDLSRSSRILNLRRRAAAQGRAAARKALGICCAPHAGDARDLAREAAHVARTADRWQAMPEGGEIGEWVGRYIGESTEPGRIPRT